MFTGDLSGDRGRLNGPHVRSSGVDPADFTPVCTTELGRTSTLHGELAKRNTKGMALSVDPIEDHRGWAPDIGEVGGAELNFPIVADPDRKVAELYDMIHAGAGDTSTRWCE